MIKKTALSDAGTVSCVLPGNKSSEARLTVLEQPVTVTIRTIEVCEGEDARLEAVLNKPVGKKDCEWSCQGSPIRASLRHSQDNDRSQITHRLTIRDVTMADAGEYTLSARKGLGKANLIVRENVCAFAKPLTDQSPMEHGSAMFEAVLTKPGHTVTWYVAGVEVAESDKMRGMQESPVKFSLAINDCLIPDTSQVTCKVFNAGGVEVCKSEARLNVSELPYDVVKGLGHLKCVEKDEVRFVCEFNKGVRAEDVRWFKDGIKLVDGEEEGRVRFEHDGARQCLVIGGALMADVGDFEIKVRDVSSAGSLKVREEEIVFVKRLKETYTVVENETLVLECATNKVCICWWFECSFSSGIFFLARVFFF